MKKRNYASSLLNKATLLAGYFAFIDGSYKAQMKSPMLPWKPFHQIVGLCLRFRYLMPTYSKSTLKVFLKEQNHGKPILVWQLSDYYSTRWSAAQVTLSGAVPVQVGGIARLSCSFNLYFTRSAG